jgi:endonuclease G, mitochondrial
MPVIGKNSEQLLIKQMNERFRKREKVRSKNIAVLSRNNPKEILKLETKKRIELRKKRISEDKEGTLEGLITGNDLMSINYLPRGIQVSKSVCRIEKKNEQGVTIKYGTGFMISPLLLITNEHVLDSRENCIKTVIQFNYEEDENFLPKQDKSFLLDPDLFFYNNKELDFALVAVKEKDTNNQISLSEFGYIKLIGMQGKILIGEFATLIHHPNKEKKQISIRENRIVDLPDKFIHYLTDSLGGSSGAPVFNDHWDVVALHHRGVEKRDDKGRRLALDNTIYDESMGEDKLQYSCNEGIRISKIIEHLEKMNNSNKFQGRSKEVLEDLLKLSTNG